MAEEQQEQTTVVAEDYEVVLDSDVTAAEQSNGDSKTEETAVVAKPVVSGDPEADERDTISMPSRGTVNKDLQDIHRSRHVIIHPATADDISNEVLLELVRTAGCEEISFQFVRSEGGLIGVISIIFCTSRQATEYVPYLQFRPDVTVQQAPAENTASNLVAELKKGKTATNPQSDAMVIVKNLDPASISIEKLAAVFPEADDIVIPKNAEHGYSGKLKGRQHALLLFKSQQDAISTVENFNANPFELDSYPLIVLQYKEPPRHVPDGFLPLSQRMLVLRQIARFKGLLVRAQEDPMLEIKPEWAERSKHAQELIEKDDAAREMLGLPKPALADFKDMTNLKNLTGKQAEVILFKLNLAEKPAEGNNLNKKRGPAEDPNQQNKKARSNIKPLMGGPKKPQKGFSMGTGPRPSGFSLSGTYSGGFGSHGRGMMQYNDYSDVGMGYGNRGYSSMAIGQGSHLGLSRLDVIQKAARLALNSMRGGRGGRW